MTDILCLICMRKIDDECYLCLFKHKCPAHSGYLQNYYCSHTECEMDLIKMKG